MTIVVEIVQPTLLNKMVIVISWQIVMSSPLGPVFERLTEVYSGERDLEDSPVVPSLPSPSKHQVYLLSVSANGQSTFSTVTILNVSSFYQRTQQGRIQKYRGSIPDMTLCFFGRFYNVWITLTNDTVANKIVFIVLYFSRSYLAIIKSILSELE